MGFFISSNAIAMCGGWEVSTIVNSKDEYLHLKSSNGQVHTVKTESVVMLNQIKVKLDQVSGMYTRLLLCDDSVKNAYALNVNGQKLTGITLGMFNGLKDDPDSLAALLGHEYAHLKHGHQESRSNANIGLGILQVLAGAALEVAIQSSTGIRGVGSDLASVGSGLVKSAYSREHEYEADVEGVKLSLAAGYDPNGAIRLQRAISATSDFFSTHPSSSDRILQLQKTIANLKPSDSFGTTQKVAKNSNDPGEGIVLFVKNRHRYFVASKIDMADPVVGKRAVITTSDGMGLRLYGKIERIVDGYFSVLVEDGILDDSLIGLKVNY